MAMQSITLTASMRTNLASLKSIQSQMDTTQERLSTGKKVNSAIDNASSYYQSRALTNRASDLEALLDSMGQGIQTIEAANQGIEAITSYEIENLVEDSSYQGINLLTDSKLTVTFNETRTNSFEIQGKDVMANINIGRADTWTTTATNQKKSYEVKTDISVAATDATTIKAGAEIYTKDSKFYAKAEDGNYYELTGFTSTDNDPSKITGASTTKLADASGIAVYETAVESYATSIDGALSNIAKATDWLRSYANELGNNYAIIQTRQDFTEAMIDVLETGSDNLVLADMNEESANYLALQTRQQLAINSLSLASQSAQSVLSLF